MQRLKEIFANNLTVVLWGLCSEWKALNSVLFFP